MGFFQESSGCECSYRGELVGLMAIHLILLSVNEVNAGLTGGVDIYLDCLKALNKVKNLPPARIPTRSTDSDVLKNILVNCSDISFDRYYSHVSAHHHNHQTYASLTREAQLNCSLTREAQLNCAMDNLAKRVLWELRVTPTTSATGLPTQTNMIFCRVNKDHGRHGRLCMILGTSADSKR